MTLRIHNSLSRATTFSTDRAGTAGCSMRHHIYDGPHRPRAQDDRRSTSSLRWLATAAASVTYVRNVTDIDDKIIRRAARRRLAARVLRAMNDGGRRYRAREPRPPEYEPKVTYNIPGNGRDRRGARRQGHAYGGQRRRLLRGAQVPRLRQALGQVDRRVARGRARRGPRGQARSARLRAVEGGQGGRADDAMAEPWDGPAGLAHRVLGDGKALLGEHSTSTAAGWTCTFRTTRTRSRRARRQRRPVRQRTGYTPARSTSTTRRCRNRSATSSPSATCSSGTTAR